MYINIPSKWVILTPCANITPQYVPLSRKEMVTASRPGTVLQLGRSHRLALSFWASLFLNLSSLTYKMKGLESLSHSVILCQDQNGNIPSGCCAWLRAITFSNSPSQRLRERAGTQAYPLFLTGVPVNRQVSILGKQVSTPGCFINTNC